MDLSQDLEVKIDTKEQRNRLTADFPNAKNWTRFHVKIEAIQCFPCYVKVTLTRKIAEGSSSSNTNPLIVRITIPGLHVQLAASRTKPFCYGLFWKNNRKRCSIFLAFPTEQDRCMHMSWLKESIKDLERYRQDFLEIRRASRCSAEVIEDQPVRFTDVFSNYQNLGPLPPIPVATETLEWSRRQSTVSGIYEEIGDPSVRRGRDKETMGNGIYEPLFRKRTDSFTQSLLAQTPPPLPPRQRINTLERDDASSSGDSDTLKKKKYKSVLESIFGKQQGVGNSRKISESSNEDGREEDAIRERFNMDRFMNIHGTIGKNKRHSMSTPELANWEEEGRERDPGQTQSRGEDVDLSEWQDVSCMSLLSESLDISAELNISDKIKPNFNLSLNASTINLVGCNFNAVRESEMGLRSGGASEKRRSLNQLGGYCVMKPIPSQSPSEEGVDVLPDDVHDSVLEKSSGYCPMGPLGFDREQIRNLDQQPVRGIVFNEERVKILSMGNVTLTRGIGDDLDSRSTDAGKLFEEEESFLRRKAKPVSRDSDTSLAKEEDMYENCKSNRNSRGSKYLVDDKMPSYLPNESPPHPSSDQVTPPKLVPKQRSRASMTPSPRLQHYSPRAVPNIYSVPRNNSPVLMDNARDTEMLKQSLTDSMSKLSLISNSPLSQPASPGSRSLKRIDLKGSPDKHQIDAVPTSPVAQKYLDKCLKTEFVSLKKFASLPRFRKLDLSPLRIKLNNVLHRHNSEY